MWHDAFSTHSDNCYYFLCTYYHLRFFCFVLFFFYEIRVINTITKVSVLVGAIWKVMLYKYSWRKVEVADNFVHSGKFQKVAASGKWWKVQKL